VTVPSGATSHSRPNQWSGSASALPCSSTSGKPRISTSSASGGLSVSGVIGAWAGPRSAGTGYLTLHHHIGDTDGHAGAWGFPRGGMGGITTALAGAARSFGAEIRTGATVARIRVTPGGQVAGVTLASGEEVDAGIVVATAHPQVTFGILVDPAVLPEPFLADIRRWQSRSGTWGRCTTPGRPPGMPTCAPRSAACTRRARPPTAAAA
jgi:phytoene dehydrogenase-like protein